MLPPMRTCERNFPGAMAPKALWAAVVLSLACLGGCGGRWSRVPDEPPPGLAPAELAEDVAWLLAEPRSAGTAASRAASERMVARFQELGLNPFARNGAAWRAPVPVAGAGGDPISGAGAGSVQMVLGRLPGRSSPVDGDLVVITCRGDASGTALLLGVAEALAADPPARSVLFLATPASDIGDLGVNRLLDTAPLARLRQIRCALHLERLGDVDTTGLDVRARAFADGPLSRLESESDAFDVPVKIESVPGILPPTAIFDSSAAVEDDPAALDAQSMSRVGRAIVRWVRWLADG